MRLDFSPEEITALAKALAPEVVRELKPLVKDKGQDTNGLFTIETLAQYLGVKKDWVYANIRHIPHYKLGRFPRFRKVEVDRWLERQRAPEYPDRRPYNILNTLSKKTQSTGDLNG